MENLANQLQAVKLKKVSGEVRDYSNPKTAGFMKEEDIQSYQNAVLDVNFEEWLDLLADFTFPSRLLPMTQKEAEVFVDIYKRLYSNLDPKAISEVSWKDKLSSDENSLIEASSKKLQEEINYFLKEENDAVFVKLSSRSPKDAPMAQQRFKSMYQDFLNKEDEHSRHSENAQIICVLKAAFKALRVTEAGQVVDMCIRSERVYQDLLLALAVPDRFRENWVVRKFVEIDVDMEFRGFVYQQRLTALSQYNYLLFSQRLADRKDEYLNLIESFFNEKIAPKMKDFVQSYIIDFAVCENEKIWIIEINPFLITTDAALFSWERERAILEGNESTQVQFRITTKPKPGAKTMLPRSIKDMMNECSEEKDS